VAHEELLRSPPPGGSLRERGQRWYGLHALSGNACGSLALADREKTSVLPADLEASYVKRERLPDRSHPARRHEQGSRSGENANIRPRISVNRLFRGSRHKPDSTIAGVNPGFRRIARHGQPEGCSTSRATGGDVEAARDRGRFHCHIWGWKFTPPNLNYPVIPSVPAYANSHQAGPFKCSPPANLRAWGICHRFLETAAA